MRLSHDIRQALDSCGAPWSIVNGKRHLKVIVNNKFCAILPKGPQNRGQNSPGRSQLNIVSQIRRAARGQPE
jgi:hypothetical protein